jgi:hypothetical protein
MHSTRSMASSNRSWSLANIKKRRARRHVKGPIRANASAGKRYLDIFLRKRQRSILCGCSRTIPNGCILLIQQLHHHINASLLGQPTKWFRVSRPWLQGQEEMTGVGSPDCLERRLISGKQLAIYGSQFAIPAMWGFAFHSYAFSGVSYQVVPRTHLLSGCE